MRRHRRYHYQQQYRYNGQSWPFRVHLRAYGTDDRLARLLSVRLPRTDEQEQLHISESLLLQGQFSPVATARQHS